MRLPASPAARATGQRHPHPCDQRTQRRAAAGIALRQTGHLLAESLPRAGQVAADQPPHGQLDHHRSAPDRKIRKAAAVIAVHPGGACPASRTGHRIRPGPRDDPHDLPLINDPIDEHRGELRKDDLQ